MAERFKISTAAKKYFSDITDSNNPDKLILFDVYYCCALVAMAAGKISESTGDDRLEDIVVGGYPGPYQMYKSNIAGALVAAEIKRLGLDPSEDDIRDTMLKYLGNTETLLSDEGVRRLNLYSIKGFRILQEHQFPDKPKKKDVFLRCVYNEIGKYG